MERREERNMIFRRKALELNDNSLNIAKRLMPNSKIKEKSND